MWAGPPCADKVRSPTLTMVSHLEIQHTNKSTNHLKADWT